VHLPSIQKALAYIDHYGCYQRLSIPAELYNSVPMKVRRMMGLPPLRIAGFAKTADDNRDWDWFVAF
jgi:hypothetical protein